MFVVPLGGAGTHSRFTPNPGAARYWSHRAFGPYWRQGLCIAYTESRYELGVSHRNSPPYGTDWGPWEINDHFHPWLHGSRATHSWRYAAYAAHRVAWHPGHPGYYDLSPWKPDCNIG